VRGVLARLRGGGEGGEKAVQELFYPSADLTTRLGDRTVLAKHAKGGYYLVHSTVQEGRTVYIFREHFRRFLKVLK
jgi:hypothetical protein